MDKAVKTRLSLLAEHTKSVATMDVRCLGFALLLSVALTTGAPESFAGYV